MTDAKTPFCPSRGRDRSGPGAIDTREVLEVAVAFPERPWRATASSSCRARRRQPAAALVDVDRVEG